MSVLLIAVINAVAVQGVGGGELSQRNISLEGSCRTGSQAKTQSQVLEGFPPSLCVNLDAQPSHGLAGIVATDAPSSGEVGRAWEAGGRAFLLGDGFARC